jgi:hypothetical protein
LIEERTTAETFKGTMEEAGHKVAEAVDWVKDKAHQAGHPVDEVAQKMENRTGRPLTGNPGAATPAQAAASVREHMVVEASCGTCVGKVDHVESDTIKLTKNDSPDGMHHRIPLSWVSCVDDRVHLDRDHREVQAQWQPA